MTNQLALKNFLAQNIYNSITGEPVVFDLAIGGYDDETEYLEITDENVEKYGDYVIYSLDIFDNDGQTHIRIELTDEKLKGAQND